METTMHYELIWRNKYLTDGAQTIDDMINLLQAAVDDLKSMKAQGVTLLEHRPVSHDCDSARRRSIRRKGFWL